MNGAALNPAFGFPRIVRRATHAGAAILALMLGSGAARCEAQQIAFTMDDLPAHGPLPPGINRLQIAKEVVKALADAGLPPTYGFTNGVRVEENPGDAAVLDLWRRSGNLLGNHTWSHMNLNGHTAQEFETEITKNETLLSAKMTGSDFRWFRYPFLAEGDTPEKRSEVRKYLATHGYRVASVTMSFGDYLWNDSYARCVGKKDDKAIASLERTYLQSARDEAQYQLQASRIRNGRAIPFVLLMHIGAFDARMLPRLLTAYKDMGFRFVSLQSAEQDPFYQADSDLLEQAGPAASAAEGQAAAMPVAPKIPAQLLNSVCR